MCKILRLFVTLFLIFCGLIFLIVSLSRLIIKTGHYYLFYAKNNYLFHMYLVDGNRNIRINLFETPCDLGFPWWATQGIQHNAPAPIITNDTDGIYIIRRPPDGDRCKL